MTHNLCGTIPELGEKLQDDKGRVSPTCEPNEVILDALLCAFCNRDNFWASGKSRY